jgi:AcrR family transcriptional regulator
MAMLLTEAQLCEVRDRILRIAEQQIALHGVNAVSLRSIASAMGWTAASLYRYFSNKAQLLDYVRTAVNNRFSDAIEAAYASSDDVWQRSRAIGDAYIDFAIREPAAYQLMFAYEAEDCDKTSELKQAEHRSKQTLTRYVRDLVNDGVLDGDPELIAHAWWAAMHGLIVLRMSGKLEDSPPFDLLRQAAARMIMRGVRTGGGAGPLQTTAPSYGASLIR